MRRKILFVTYGGGHVNMIIPVVRALEERPEFECQVLGLTTASAALERASIPHIGFRDLVRPGDEAALTRGRVLAGENSNSAVAREETEAYLGLSYAEMEVRLGIEGAAQAYAHLGRQAFLPIGVMRRFLAEFAPDLLVATSSPRAERAALLAAGELGIPAVCLVDLFASDEVAWVGEPGYATRVCVLSEFVRSRVAARRDGAEVVVTGNPAFDRLADPAVVARAAALRRELGWEGQRVVLWASQPEPARHTLTGVVGDPELPRRIEACLFAIVARHSDWHLVVRPHPSEDHHYGDLPERVHLSQPAEDLAPLLHAVNAVVVMSSTVGLEAALVGKPVVSVTMSVFSESVPFGRMGLARDVAELDELEEALGEALIQEHPTGELTPAGSATSRVIDCLVETLGMR